MRAHSARSLPPTPFPSPLASFTAHAIGPSSDRQTPALHPPSRVRTRFRFCGQPLDDSGNRRFDLLPTAPGGTDARSCVVAMLSKSTTAGLSFSGGLLPPPPPPLFFPSLVCFAVFLTGVAVLRSTVPPLVHTIVRAARQQPGACASLPYLSPPFFDRLRASAGGCQKGAATALLL